jgi:glyoxylase-like metal-dependent hydrolase (beta-lactamase superfamily II)
MLAKPIVPGLFAISLGFVNVFLLDTGSGLALVDTGIPGSGERILSAIRELGYQPKDLRAILITHLHQDHIGGLAELKSASGARVYMHAIEAQAYSAGKVMREVEPSPGWLNGLIVRAMTGRPPAPNPHIVPVDVELQGGEVIEEAGGMRAIHTPGHTAGHLVYFWPEHGGVMLMGDIASHMLSLGYSFLYEDFKQGRRTLAEVSGLNFETACFSHGGPIRSGAAREFGRKFAQAA